MDSELVKIYVSQECNRLRDLQRNIRAGSSFSGNLSSIDAQRLLEFELIARLLAESVGNRPSAQQACKSDVFCIASDPDLATQPTESRPTDTARVSSFLTSLGT